MAGCICVYLHGFLSSENSQKGQWFKQHLPDLVATEGKTSSIQVLTPGYPMADPTKSVAFLTDFIKQAGLMDSDQNWFLVGSSMGGFYAQYLAHLFNRPYIMINPALDPMSLFKDYAGEHLNQHTGEVITVNQAYREALKAYYQTPSEQVKSLLLLDKEDEVIPYQQALDLYQTGCLMHINRVFSGGDHAFQHLAESSNDIKNFVIDLLDEK